MSSWYYVGQKDGGRWRKTRTEVLDRQMLHHIDTRWKYQMDIVFRNAWKNARDELKRSQEEKKGS